MADENPPSANIEALQKMLGDEFNVFMEAYQEGAKNAAEVAGFTPEQLNAIEQIGIGYYRARVYGTAILVFHFILQLDGERSTTWRALGACNQALKAYYAAGKCYQRAVALDPDDVVSKVYWGECLCLVGLRENGLELLRDVIAKGTSNTALLPYITRARAIVNAEGGTPTRLVLMEQGLAAAESAESMQGFDPAGNPDMTAEELMKIPEMKAAIEEIKQALEKGTLTYAEVGGFTPNELEGAYAAACKYLEMKQPMMALQMAGYLAFLDPYQSKYFQLMGISMQNVKMYEQADQFFRLALNLEPTDARSLVFRGECKIMAGHTDEGLKCVKQGMELGATGPEFADVVERSKVLLKQFGGK